MVAVATTKDILDAANTVIENSLEALDPNLAGTWQLLSRGMGTLNSCIIDLGWTESIGGHRKYRFGEEPEYCGVRAYGAKYDPCVIKKGLTLPRKHIDYDPSGRLGKSLSDFVGSANDIMDDFMWGRLLANNITGPNGQPLFSGSHPFGPGGTTQSNISASALDVTSYAAAKAAMGTYQREDGRYVGAYPTHLFVHPNDEGVAKQLINADRPITVDSAGEFDPAAGVVGIACCQNIYAGDVILVVTPRVPAGEWILASLSNRSELPLVHSFNRELPEVIETYSAAEVAEKDAYKWLMTIDVTVGVGHWQRIFRGGYTP